MGTLSLGTKRRVINSVAQHPVTISGAGQAQVMNIEGFGSFNVADLAGTYRASRARAASKHKHVIVPANITLGAIAGETIVNVMVAIESVDWAMEFARYGDQYGKPKNFQLVVNTGETKDTFLRKLHAAIEAENIEDDFNLVKTTLAEAAGAVTSITLEGREPGLSFKISFLDDNSQKSAAVAVYAPTVTRTFEGLGTYKQMQTIVLQNNTTVDPYSLESLQLARPDGMYTSIIFAQSVARPELSGSAAAGAAVEAGSKFQVYLLESAENAAARDAILNFLGARNPALPKELTDKNGAVAADLAAFNA